MNYSALKDEVFKPKSFYRKGGKMRIAKDGKPFDTDPVNDDGRPDEVEVIQFLRPAGIRCRMLAPVGEEFVAKAKDMVITAECLNKEEVSLTIRFVDEPEEKEIMDIAINGPGKNSPSKTLKRLIAKKAKERLIQGEKEDGSE